MNTDVSKSESPTDATQVASDIEEQTEDVAMPDQKMAETASPVNADENKPSTNNDEDPDPAHPEEIDIDKLSISRDFEDLFPRSKDVLAKVIKDMKTNDFDPAHPIITWTSHENNADHVIVDGHTRYEAAKQVGLKSVWVVNYGFSDESEALDYAILCQQARRNLTDAELFKIIDKLHKKPSGIADAQPATKPGKTAAHIAEKLNTSPRKVERARRVLEQASPEVQEKVQNGQLSINAAERALASKPPKQTGPDYNKILKGLEKLTAFCGDDAKARSVLIEAKKDINECEQAHVATQKEEAVA